MVGMKKLRPYVAPIRKAVELAGSQDKLSRLTGIPQGTISRWLQGSVTRFPYDVPMRIERATDGRVKAQEFFDI